MSAYSALLVSHDVAPRSTISAICPNVMHGHHPRRGSRSTVNEVQTCLDEYETQIELKRQNDTLFEFEVWDDTHL